jgi:hypothetical protein
LDLNTSDLDLTRLFNLDTAVVPVGKRETRRKRFDKTTKEIDTVLIDDDEGDDEVEIIEPLCSVAQADDPDGDIKLIEVDLENAEETFGKPLYCRTLTFRQYNWMESSSLYHPK